MGTGKDTCTPIDQRHTFTAMHPTVHTPTLTHLAHNKGDILKVQSVMDARDGPSKLSLRGCLFHRLRAWRTLDGEAMKVHKCYAQLWNK